MQLKDKTAIVTGGARGMGRSHCIELARAGADIAVVDIARNIPESGYKMGDITELEEVVSIVEKMGRKATAIQCDVTDETQVKDMISTVTDRFGKIDILVNNVGIVRPGIRILEMEEKTWDFIFRTNLRSQFLCCKHAAVPMIKQRSGKIINIGSTTGRLESASGNVYGVTKAAIHAFAHIMASELAPYNINVNCVAPGSVMNTGMRQIADPIFAKKLGVKTDEVMAQLMHRSQLLQQPLMPDDISHAVVFLASEEARNITGMVVYVDGGHP